MGEVKRYAAGWDDQQERVTLLECSDGPLIKYPDYLSLQIVNVTRFQHIEAQQDTIATLKDELTDAKEHLDEFKTFHWNLCKRFGYCHDEVDWKRDQISLIEFIAVQLKEARQQIDVLSKPVSDEGAPYESDRCQICGWPLSESERGGCSMGCVTGNCSMRAGGKDNG